MPSPPKRQRFPSKKEILSYIQENPNKVGKRDIARAFGLIGAQRVKLKDVLRDMKTEGLIAQGRGRRFAEKGTLPDVTVLTVIGTDNDGDVLAKPKDWDGEDEPPLI